MQKIFARRALIDGALKTVPFLSRWTCESTLPPQPSQ